MEDTLYEIRGEAVIVKGKEAKFFTGSDYPVVLLKDDDGRLLIIDNISDLKRIYYKEKYGIEGRRLVENYTKTIAGWFMEKNKDNYYKDTIGFQSLYFGGQLKGIEFEGVEKSNENRYVRFMPDKWDDGEGFYYDIERDFITYYGDKSYNLELRSKNADFMRALNIVHLFCKPRMVYGYTKEERNLPPVPQEVIDGIVKVIPEWKGLKNKKIVSKMQSLKWVGKVKSSDDIYALAYAVRKYVAGLIITGKTAVEGDFLEVWKAYEDERVKELGREDLRIVFDLKEIQRFMMQSSEKKEKKAVKEISIGL